MPSERFDQNLPEPCPRRCLTEARPTGANSTTAWTLPFFEISVFAQLAYVNREAAALSIEVQEFDAYPDMHVCILRDPVLLKILRFLNDQPSAKSTIGGSKDTRQRHNGLAKWATEAEQSGACDVHAGRTPQRRARGGFYMAQTQRAVSMRPFERITAPRRV